MAAPMQLAPSALEQAQLLLLLLQLVLKVPPALLEQLSLLMPLIVPA